MSGPRIGSLCSGMGGLDAGAMSVIGGTVAWHCEYATAPSKILAHHWPDVPNHHDLTATDWAAVEPVDVLTGGWPCQPWSLAGKRKGADDERAIWPAIAGAIRVLRPRYVLLENVAAIVAVGELERAVGSLAQLGYDASWRCLRASDVGAPHGRNRCFIAATDTTHLGYERGWLARGGRAGPTNSRRAAADASDARLEGCRPIGRGTSQPEPVGGADIAWGPYEPAIRRWELVLGRTAPAPTELGARGGQRLSPRFVEFMMGLPDGHVTDVPGVSRNDQLKALGNGVVPQQAAAAYRALLTPQRARVAA